MTGQTLFQADPVPALHEPVIVTRGGDVYLSPEKGLTDIHHRSVRLGSPKQRDFRAIRGIGVRGGTSLEEQKNSIDAFIIPVSPAYSMPNYTPVNGRSFWSNRPPK
jgi:hypothetical protein